MIMSNISNNRHTDSVGASKSSYYSISGASQPIKHFSIRFSLENLSVLKHSDNVHYTRLKETFLTARKPCDHVDMVTSPYMVTCHMPWLPCYLGRRTLSWGPMYCAMKLNQCAVTCKCHVIDRQCSKLRFYFVHTLGA